MDWSMIWIVAGLLAVMVIWKRLSLIPPAAAREHLREGALVVDVRSAGEFRGGHLPDAVNIPLDELQDGLPRHVTDKARVLLLHCLSGTRSGIARRQLKSTGYQNVYNLGSYRRARQIVSGVRDL